MPYPTALSAPDQTKYRNGARSTIRRVIAHTPTVIFQFNPSANADGTSASQIPFSVTLQGAYTNVLQYMTVYITPTTDYVNDLQTQPENCLRTYVRKDPTSAILYIGLTAFQWTTASYVTVVDNFEVFEKKTVIEGDIIYKDSDVSYRAPLPRITGNYHRVTVTNASAANVSPTPTETAMASGASISSRTWAMVENGVVTKAVSTSATPTFNLDLGTHWLHLTTTDSNGNTCVSVAFVAVVPDDYSDVISDMTCENVDTALDSGLRADIIAYADTGSQLTTLVPGTFGIVFTEVVFTDDTKVQHVEMCGWFDAPVALEYAGDEQFGVRKQYSTQIIGVKDAAASIRIPAFPFEHAASPDTWGEVARCTVYDAIWYTLSEHSTIAHIASVEFPSNYTDYQFNPALQVPSGAIMDSVENQAFRASAGTINYAPNGELIFEQSAIYATSGRDSLTTYATYDAGEHDALRYSITRPSVNRFALSSVQAGFATWNTTTNRPRVYRSVAPANQTPAALFEQIDGVIMTKNLTNTNALIEAGKLASNHFFAANESLQFDVDFVDGYLPIPVSAYHWHKFNVPATALLDGSSFDSNTRFLCIRKSVRYDVELGRFVTTGTFRQETDGGDNYARETEFVPSDTTQVEPVYPLGTFSPFLEEFDIQNAADTYGTNFNDANAGIEDPTVAPEVAAENSGNNPGTVETLYVPVTGGVVSSTIVSELGRTYILRVSGTGYIAQAIDAGEWCYEWDFTQSDGGFSIYNVFGNAAGEWVDGVGWQYTDTTNGAFQYRAITIKSNTFASFASNITEWLWQGDYTYGHFGVGGGNPDLAAAIAMYNSNDGILYHTTYTEASDPNYSGTSVIKTESGLQSQTGTFFWFQWYSSNDDTVPVTVDGNVVIPRLRLHGTGTMPEFTGGQVCGDIVYADGLFYSDDLFASTTKHANGSFLYLDGNAIPNDEDFSSSHVYELEVTGTGSAFQFSFTDGYNGLYSDNDAAANLRVEIVAT